MSEKAESYQAKILEQFTYGYLRSAIEKNNYTIEELINKADQLVWDVSRSFYAECGHAANFDTVKATVDSYTQTLIDLSEKENSSKAEQIENSKEKAQQPKDTSASLEDDIDSLSLFPNSPQKKNIFCRLRCLLIEKLCVDKEEIQLEKRLNHDLGADNMDCIELFIAIEEEFEIEIPDSDCEEKLSFYYSPWPTGTSFLGMLGAMSSMSANTSETEGASCSVGEMVEYLYEKITDSDTEPEISVEQESVTSPVELSENKYEYKKSDIGEIWKQVIATIEYRSTQMLLRQQSQLINLTDNEAQIAVTQQWFASIQTRQAAIENALCKVLNRSVKIYLFSVSQKPDAL